MKRRDGLFAAAAGLVLAASVLSGCAACPGVKADPGRPAVVIPHVAPPVAPPVAPAVVGGPYSIDITPGTDVNPVRTQHVMLATVRDQSGNPVSGAKVEWILARGPRAVGDIVDVEGGRKVDNTYADSVTGSGNRVLDMGTADASDDVQVGPGQTWCVITSTAEGTSNVIAYAPQIANWSTHKAFAEKNWMDVTWDWPADATNRVGTPHTFNVRVLRYSDSTPYAGYRVNYKLLSGPAGSLGSGGQMASVTTGADGIASVVLNQSAPQVGTNEVEISIVRPAKKDECECWPEKLIATGVVRKHWVAPDLGITKTAPATAMLCETFSYNIGVSSLASDVELRDVVLTDPLPEGVDYVSSSPAANVSGRTLTWNIGTMAPSATQNFTVTVKPNRKGMTHNCAKVTAEGGRLSKDACADTNVIAPAVKIEKYAPAEVMICDPITYRIVVRNTGDGMAGDLRVVDQLPAGLTTASGDTRVEFPAFTLGAGESREFTFDAKASAPGSYTNTASLKGACELSDQASATTRVKACALTLVKKARMRDVKTGLRSIFDLTVSNAGDAEAKDVYVEDQIPAGMTFVKASNGGTSNGSTVVWNIGSLAPGASTSVTVEMVTDTIGTYKNTATARAYCCKDATAGDVVEYSGVVAILLEVIDVNDPIYVGDQETYVITVTNQGSADDRNVRVTVTLPAEQKFTSYDTSKAANVKGSVSGQVVRFDPVPALPGKQTGMNVIEYRVVCEATGKGDVRFAVKLESDMLTGGSVDETESTHQY